MDPISQGVVGAIGATQASKKHNLGLVTLLGFASGLTPDLDVLIGSSTDPLLGIEYHRHFTHSLLFAPFGALLCAIFFYCLFARKRLSFKETYLYCALGYGTHALLDACTTYGTVLLWPLTDMRVAWNNISIIDPLFTIPLLIFIVLNLRFKKRWLTHGILIYALAYLGLGLIQRDRAVEAGWELAAKRGYDVIKLEAKPSFANLIVWKIITTTADDYYVDAVKVGLTKKTFFEGSSVPKFDINRDMPWLDKNSQQAKDIERFRWFSNGYIAMSPTKENLIIDMRYSMLPNEIKGMWGVKLNPNAGTDEHVDYVESTERSPEIFSKLWEMIVY